MIWRACDRSWEFPRPTLVMGVVNVTPDSFSDGGDALALEDALRRGKAMLDAGVGILGEGGEWTRPGAAPGGIEEESARAVPVARGLWNLGTKVSIDTRHAPVMEAAIEAGATIINDVTALSHDPDSLDLAVASGLPVILMHMQGDPGTMQDNPQYEDAAQDVFDYLKQRVAECEAAGMDRSRIAIDPGIGFGKTVDHNLDILARLNLYRDFKCPVLLGVSRKTFIGKLGGDAAPKERLGGSLAAVLAAAARGVRLFRVHDVAETRQALTIWQAIEKK